MTTGRSLLSRLVTGALVWTIVIMVIAHLVSLSLVRHFSGHMGIVHFALLGLVGIALLLAVLVLIRSGLSPLHELRTRLADLRTGRASRIEGQHPSEVQPLVDDLNAMLEDRERRVTRAQAKAGDLAHGLKTPLALLVLEAEKLRTSGHEAAALTMFEQIERMRGQVEHHLAQARAASSGISPETRCLVRESAEPLTRTMLKLHAHRALAIDLRVAEGLGVRVQRADLDEMLGNLLDNAARFAATRIVLEAVAGSGRVLISVDDDGPGIAPELRERVLRRGVRADEAAPGSGLGLAIVREVAEIYGGSIALESSPLGGLRATLRLPG